MIERIMISGSGGDGAVFMGKLLSWAAMAAQRGFYTTGLPSYGPEIRGGTSRTEVVVSDVPIGSPVLTQMDSLIVYNDMSLDRFEPGVVPGGLIVLNADVVTRLPKRNDVTVMAVHCSAEAVALGSARSMNVVSLGVWAAHKAHVLDRSALVEGLKHVTRHPKVFEINCKALDRGLAIAREMNVREPALAR
ncbi:MAG TPA: 2-oxoacid:acceptor oxidoreductase family protein [Gemmatimonadales bacterium]|nr:2-oxoacid:acceptor oxidoreductase family protein [Gemmatimonadales bacterium]